MQTKNKNLIHLLSDSAKEKNIRLISVGTAMDLQKHQLNGEVIGFIIGSDVEDPVQSAQRLHAFKKSAKIIILSETEQSAENLRKVIKFSPFIGVDVFCLHESKRVELEDKLDKILENSRQAAKYRAIIQETNSQISQQSPPKETAFTQNFINRLMDIAPVGIAIVGQKGKILGWNKEAASIFKKNEARVLGMPLSRYFDLTEGYKLESYLRQNFEEITASADTLTLTRDLNNPIKQILNFTAAHFTYADGTKQALLLTIKDVTKRKQAEKELQELNASLEERVAERTSSLLAYQNQLRSLASQLSKAEEKERRRLAAELHDNLGQLLALVKMKIGSLAKYDLPEDPASVIDNIKEGVDDALVYTRFLMTDLKPPPSINQKDIRISIEWLAGKMKNHDLRVSIEEYGQPKPVDDEIRTVLVQCVRELLFNIVKHAGVTEAWVSVQYLDEEFEIVVKDKGKGFDIKTGLSISDEGGFGLFNITERIDLLGGSVDIKSKPGKGSKITIRTPLTQETQNGNEPDNKFNETVSETKKPRKIKVMLVDDHEMMRAGLRKIVNEQDDLMVIAESSDGESAIVAAEETVPDVVVMDVNLPVMNGIDTTRKLLERMPGLRIIALSIHDHQTVVNSMRSAGATAYLTKNEAFETLCATIRTEAKLAGNHQ
ncbi:MAG: response regulator [Balneolaceae bacterium]